MIVYKKTHYCNKFVNIQQFKSDQPDQEPRRLSKRIIMRLLF